MGTQFIRFLSRVKIYEKKGEKKRTWTGEEENGGDEVKGHGVEDREGVVCKTLSE